MGEIIKHYCELTLWIVISDFYDIILTKGATGLDGGYEV